MKRNKLSLTEFIQLVKKKKELSDLDSSMIERFILEWCKHHKNFETLSFSEQKILLKEVRAKMRRASGMFATSEYKEDETIDSLLSKHKSTSERQENYTEFINKLSSLLPTSILDLGCGLNPLALLPLKVPVTALDIREQELKIIEREYSKQGIPIKIILQDLSLGTSNLPQADIILVLKVLDLLSKKKREISRELLKLNSRFLIVSFPTCRLSGRRMEHPRRRWFEFILNKESKHFTVWETKNEIFYFISLSK